MVNLSHVHSFSLGKKVLITFKNKIFHMNMKSMKVNCFYQNQDKTLNYPLEITTTLLSTKISTAKNIFLDYLKFPISSKLL
jgi:hypothetical protein